MLIYESEGSFTADEESIELLYRSTRMISLVPHEGDPFEVQALLCQHKVEGESRYHCAFHCRALKRTLVFAVKGASDKLLLQGILQVFDSLGLEPEPVNLNLSPAMRQVVLRDIPGLLSPEEALKQRSEKASQRAELEQVLRADPDSYVGKKAKLKLQTEQRLDDRAAALRELLVEQFMPADEGNADVQALLSQLKDLSIHLEKTEILLEEERTKRNLAEGIMAAAEKRIQELEEILVDLDTKKSDAVKFRQKIIQLEKQVTELNAALSAARDENEIERDKQDQLVEDIKTAHARIAVLEKDLADATEIATAVIEAEDAAVQAEKRITELQAELETTKEQLAEEQTAKESVQQNLDEVQDAKAELEGDLAQIRQDSEKAAAVAQQVEEFTARVEALTVELEQTRTELKLERDAKDVFQQQSAEQVAAYEKKLAESEQIQAKAIEAEARLKEARQQVAELTNELELSRSQAGQFEQKYDSLKSGLVEARSRIKSLETDLKTAEKSRDEAVANREQLASFRQRLEVLVKEQDVAREELAHERSIRNRLEKGAVEDEKRILQLETRLATGVAGHHETGSSEPDISAIDLRLKARLDKALVRLAEEVELRERLETELDDAHVMIETQEKALKSAKHSTEGSYFDKSSDQNIQQNEEFAEKLKAVEAQLEHELLENRKSAEAYSAAEKRIAELEERLTQTEKQQSGPAISEPISTRHGEPRKPLPHELRPQPKKGAIFHPDWDLQGLPCQTADHVLQAWESVYNVQLSLEGYPSQYCSAFLVVLKVGKRKSLFMLFRLKKDKHTLVCVPAKSPADEVTLKKAIEEGKRYLQLSGFELEELAPENVSGALDSYFVG